MIILEEKKQKFRGGWVVAREPPTPKYATGIVNIPH